MKKLLLLLAIVCFSCSKEPSVIATNPSGDVGKIDQNGIAVVVDKPDHPACSRNYVSVQLDTFQHCLVEGLTYVQVANILGYQGTLGAEAGGSEVWQWNGREGVLTATFSGGRLVSKSQAGLISGI